MNIYLIPHPSSLPPPHSLPLTLFLFQLATSAVPCCITAGSTGCSFFFTPEASSNNTPCMEGQWQTSTHTHHTHSSHTSYSSYVTSSSQHPPSHSKHIHPSTPHHSLQEKVVCLHESLKALLQSPGTWRKATTRRPVARQLLMTNQPTNAVR